MVKKMHKSIDIYAELEPMETQKLRIEDIEEELIKQKEFSALGSSTKRKICEHT